MLVSNDTSFSFCSVAVALSPSTASLSVAAWSFLKTALPIAISSGTVTNASPSSTRPSKVRGRRIFIGRSSPRATPLTGGELPFPRERGLDDVLEVVVARLPAERRADARGARHERRRISGSARGFPFRNRMSRDRFDHGQELAHAVAAAVAAVQRRRLAAAAQIGEGLQMRVGEILDVDVVANPGAVFRRV